MVLKGPCKESATSPDCPNRSAGCHSSCEKYLAFREKCDEVIRRRRENMISIDYARESAWRKRKSILQTGMFMISQR